MMYYLPRTLAAIVITLPFLNASPVLAGPGTSLRIPHVFGDHMVLQSGQPAPIWGWAKSGESITVQFAGQKKETTCAPAYNLRRKLQ